MNRVNLIIAFFLTILTGVVFHFYFSESEFSLQNVNSSIKNATDNTQGGNSKLISKKILNGIDVSFTLKEGKNYPFAGAKLVFDSLIDLSSYSSFCFDIKGSRPNNSPIIIGIKYLDGSSLPVQFLDYNVDIDTIKKSFEIPLEKFTPPPWWLNIKGIQKADLKKIDFSKVIVIGISNGYQSKIDEEETVQFDNMVFKKRLIWPYYLLGVILLVLLALLLKPFIKKTEKDSLQIQYQPTINEEGKNDIIDFITSNYMNNQMSSFMVQDSLGVSESKVTNEVKTHTQFTFKQFLNQLRIEESKRLLKTSDLRVNEVADKVGYENITHFNRTFKSMTGFSPSNYRKTLKTGDL